MLKVAEGVLVVLHSQAKESLPDQAVMGDTTVVEVPSIIVVGFCHWLLVEHTIIK